MKYFLLINKNKIIIGFVILMVLGAAFFLGGRPSGTQENVSASVTALPKPTKSPRAEKTKPPEQSAVPTEPAADKTEVSPLAEPSFAPETHNDSGLEEQEISYDEDVYDYYMSASPPEGVPAPSEPQDAVITETENVCTLSVRCDTILNNMDKLKPGKEGLIPPDGIIFPAAEVVFHEGESVFNVLQREMKKNKIHMEFVNTPSTNSAYIEGINNIYEFDCGQNSGWTYKVNGKSPNYGCSRYTLKPGDIVEWIYTCDGISDTE